MNVSANDFMVIQNASKAKNCCRTDSRYFVVPCFCLGCDVFEDRNISAHALAIVGASCRFGGDLHTADVRNGCIMRLLGLLVLPRSIDIQSFCLFANLCGDTCVCEN